MFQEINEIVSYIQYSEFLRWVLLFIGALLSALFSELIFKDRDWTLPIKWLMKWLKQQEWIKKLKWLQRWEWTEKRERRTKQIVKWLWYSIICVVVFLLSVAVTLMLLFTVLKFSPQQESFKILLKSIAKTQGTDFIIPLIATLLAVWALNNTKKKTEREFYTLCFIDSFDYFQ